MGWYGVVWGDTGCYGVIYGVIWGDIWGGTGWYGVIRGAMG